MTVTVLSYNHPDLTSRAVRSVQKIISDSQILLLHNGSRKDCEMRLRREFATISHASIAQNHGFSQGANLALRESFTRFKTDWVLFVTNDCELTSIESWPSQPGLYAPLIYRRSRNKIDSVGAWFCPTTGKLRHARDLNQRPRGFFKQEFYVPGTAFLLHRKIWQELCDDQVNVFDESLHTYWEDVDFSMRANAKDLNVGVWPGVKLIHKVGKTCHKDPYYTRYLFKRNRFIISRRYTPRWLRPIQSLWLRPVALTLNSAEIRPQRAVAGER